MTNDLADRLRELEKKSTPPPWHAPDPGWQPPESMGMRDQYPDGWWPEHVKDYRVNADALDSEEENGVAYQLEQDDAKLIAAMRNALPAILAALETLSSPPLVRVPEESLFLARGNFGCQGHADACPCAHCVTARFILCVAQMQLAKGRGR